MELNSLDSTRKLAEIISKNLKNNDFLLLKGTLGSGKTTFSKFLVRALQKKNKIKPEEVLSPTFNIVQYYDLGKNSKVAHYDFYRLKQKSDINYLGFFDTAKNFINIIEWPELIIDSLTEYLQINFIYNIDKDIRSVKINGKGKWFNFSVNE